MKFKGGLLVQSRSIIKAAEILQSKTAPDLENQNLLLWFLGLMTMRGKGVLLYDGTIDGKVENNTDTAISSLGLHDCIRPDHDAGLLEEPPVTAWEKALRSGAVERVLESPPPIPKEFPPVESAAELPWLVQWDEVLQEFGRGIKGSQFKELLLNKQLRGNKLLAGLAKCSQVMGPENSGASKVIERWSKSSIEERYLLASGLINGAFRPFLLVSMANESGSVALLEEELFRTFTRYEHSVVRTALNVILKASAEKVDVTEDCLVDDEPDLILLAGLKVLREVHPQKGPMALLEKARDLAKQDTCLSQFFHSIVLKSAGLRAQHPQELVEEMNAIKTDLTHSGLCVKVPAPRKWLNTINRNMPDIAQCLGTLGSAAAAQLFTKDFLTFSTAGILGGQAAKEVTTKLVACFSPQTDKADIDAAASAWGKLSTQWINDDQVRRDIGKFWHAR